MSIYAQIAKEAKLKSSPQKIADHLRFFKTAPGEYGEGDQFLGIVVPDQRIIAKKYFKGAQLIDIEQLLLERYHELRSIALMMIVYQFPKVDLAKKLAIYDFYLGHTQRINNWDLVDISAPSIVGEYILSTKLDMKKLLRLAQSPLLWERRISIIATLAFIRAVKKGRAGREWLQPPLHLAGKLLADTHDLMHKAVGWVLREVGKVDERVLMEFLDQHHCQMPRTALRYSIEHFSEKVREQYLRKIK